ncbi:transposase [Reticulibacter mediterranei]|uniref:transposase n=1 Tax=Reticulibacter mediterranei TaxID=2778369 RepID=UPI001C687DEA
MRSIPNCSGEKREPIEHKPRKVRREDYEYSREGVCNVFLAVEPLSGNRFAQVRSQRTRQDWAYFMKEVLDVHYQHAEKVVLVLDNLNTHTRLPSMRSLPHRKPDGSRKSWRSITRQSTGVG